MISPRPGPLWLRFAERPARSMVLTGLAATIIVGISLALNGTAVVGWQAATRSTAAFAYGFWLLALNSSALGGGLGFAWVAAMAATSNDAAIERLGRVRWRRLHLAGQILLFGIFAITYAGRVANDRAFWPGLALLLGALGIRLAAALQSARLRSRILPTE